MKVSIPRETLEKIQQDFGVSEQEATRAYLNAFDEAEEYFWEAVEEHMARAGKGSHKPELQPNNYTPREIKAYLDKYVIGQEEYKKRIAIASAFHFMTIRMFKEGKQQGFRRFRKKNTLIAGPSGSGKTYCIEVLGDLLEVPTLIVDATDYTEAGYVGKSADDMVRELIDLAPGANKREQAAFINKNGGLIFIDELDKKAREGSASHDISREGFQRAILKLIERKQVSIENPMSPSAQIQDLMERQKGDKKKNENAISTEKILFILGGSFQRASDPLEQIIRKRLSRKYGATDDDGNLVIGGFHTRTGADEAEFKSYFPQAAEGDYIKFGIIPELVGRTPIRSYVNHLSKNDLIRIMTDTEDSLLKQYKLEFDAFGVEVEFSEDAIDYVAEQAEKNKTGARALISVWEDILTDFQYELPGSEHTRVVVTKEVCEAPQDYLLKLLARTSFEDFSDKFFRENGIRLVFTEDAADFVKDYAKSSGIQESEALKILLAGVSALNYLGYNGEFSIEKHMLEKPGYFDDMYARWYKDNLKNHSDLKN